MTELQKYINDKFGQVRATEINGEAWFAAVDICRALGYVNSRKALADHVDDGDKGVTELPTFGGIQTLNIINESGLYSLIFGSRLPKARDFRHWITSEVLPSIRKHGAYMTEQTLNKALTSPDFLIQLATQLKEEQAKNKKLERR